MWSLSNAFTSAFKELDPIPQFKATSKLGRIPRNCPGGLRGSKSVGVLPEGVFDLQVPESLAVLEVFAVQDAALAFHRRGDDQGVKPG